MIDNLSNSTFVCFNGNGAGESLPMIEKLLGFATA